MEKVTLWMFVVMGSLAVLVGLSLMIKSGTPMGLVPIVMGSFFVFLGLWAPRHLRDLQMMGIRISGQKQPTQSHEATITPFKPTPLHGIWNGAAAFLGFFGIQYLSENHGELGTTIGFLFIFGNIVLFFLHIYRTQKSKLDEARALGKLP